MKSVFASHYQIYYIHFFICTIAHKILVSDRVIICEGFKAHISYRSSRNGSTSPSPSREKVESYIQRVTKLFLNPLFIHFKTSFFGRISTSNLGKAFYKQRNMVNITCVRNISNCEESLMLYSKRSEVCDDLTFNQSNEQFKLLSHLCETYE